MNQNVEIMQKKTHEIKEIANICFDRKTRQIGTANLFWV